MIETFGKVDRKIEYQPAEPVKETTKVVDSVDEKQRLHNFESEIQSLLQNMA